MGSKVSIRQVLIIAGAFVSFTIGSGFASGNEVLQFFGSWGFPDSLWSVIGAAVITAIYCIGLYKAGQYVQFEKTNECYNYFGGKYLGWFFRAYVFVNVTCVFMTMFAGAGSLLNQHFGCSKWVGIILIAIISAVIVVGGFKTVENVLGYAGIVIIAYTLVFGVISLFSPTSSFDQAALADEMVADGQIWQANLLALFPLSEIPGLADMNNALLEGVLYGAICIVSGFPFMIALGKRTKNNVEATTAGIITSIAFYACVAFVLVILLTNFNSLINPQTGVMFDFPTLAAVDALWPSGSWTYVVIIFIGIFTTISGYLWVLCDMFFPGQERTVRTNVFTIVIILVGMLLGSVIPFSAIVNFIWPISGFVGLIMTAAVLIRTIRGPSKEIREKIEREKAAEAKQQSEEATHSIDEGQEA